MLLGRPEIFRIMTVIRFIALSVSCAALASCENMKKTGSDDPYASNYGNDGHYNPYPGQTGYAQKTTPAYQKPPMPVEPEPPADPYAFSASKKTTPSSTSTIPKKTVASSSSAKEKSTPSKSTTKKSSSGSRYTVVKGDTLYGIALKKKTTVAKIKAANGLSGDLIRPGQSLKIP
jgi:LysM repeat protein